MSGQLLDQKPLVEGYLRKRRNFLSAFSFTNIFLWQDFFRFEFKVISGCLCVLARDALGCFLYLPPLGENVTRQVIRECFRIMEEENGAGGITRMENVGVGQLSLFPQDQFKHFRKGHEYCYYRKDIASLTGNRYKSHRSSYHQLVRSGTFRYAPYEDRMYAECTALYLLWARKRREACHDETYCQMLDENQKVHAIGLRHFKQIGLTGRVVIGDGAVIAYSFGYPVSDEMFCVLFEIADPGFKGLPVYIFREFCRDAALESYLFVNVMDDFALDNIRKAKMSFRPCVLLPMYVVTRKK